MSGSAALADDPDRAAIRAAKAELARAQARRFSINYLPKSSCRHCGSSTAQLRQGRPDPGRSGAIQLYYHVLVRKKRSLLWRDPLYSAIGLWNYCSELFRLEKRLAKANHWRRADDIESTWPRGCRRPHVRDPGHGPPLLRHVRCR